MRTTNENQNHRVVPLDLCDTFYYEPNIMSPLSPLSPTEEEGLKTAKREVLEKQFPSRFSTIETFINKEDNKITSRFNKLKNIMKDFEGLRRIPRRTSVAVSEEDKNDELLLNDDSKSIRRQVTINGGISVLKRYKSSDSVRYMLHNIDRTLNDTLPFHDNNNTLASSSSKETNCIAVETSIPIPATVNTTIASSTNKYTIEEDNHWLDDDDISIVPITYSDESNNNSPVYITSEKLKDPEETVLEFSSTPSSPILMDKSKELHTTTKKIWAMPYFTALSTIAILSYFITSLIYNSTLTGHAIQLSPFNQMIGPAPETLVYLGARYVPCIKPSNSYPTTEKKYTCPFSKTDSPPEIEDNNTIIDQDILIVEKCTLDVLCGGPKFSDPNIPDQTYRFFSALFMHSGIVQLITNMVPHIWIGYLVERRIDSIRYSIIWVGSGVFGYIFGAVFVPEGNVSVGCSASLMGIMGFLVIDLILNWKNITRPRITAYKITACFIFSIIIGLLPGYDNFSHFGGFLAGLLITLIVMPFAQIEDNSSLNDEVDVTKIIKYEQLVQFWMMRIMAVSFIVILIWILLHLFLTNLEQLDCDFCQFLSCITFNDMCTSKIK